MGYTRIAVYGLLHGERKYSPETSAFALWSMQTTPPWRARGAASPHRTAQTNTGPTPSIALRCGFDASEKSVKVETEAGQEGQDATLSPYSLASCTGMT